MQLDLKKIPFGQACSRHLLFEEADAQGKGWQKGLFLALATESSSLFGFGGASRGAGFISLTPTVGGEEAAFTAEADPAKAVMRCQGGSIRMAIDGDAFFLTGEGVGLKMVVRLNRGETITKTERGYEIIMSGNRYIFGVKKGSVDMHVGWDLVGLHSTDPVITITPEGGAMEAVFRDTTAAYELQDVAADVDAAAAKAKAAFEEFRASLRGEDELLSYVVWMNLQPFKDGKLMFANKNGDIRVVALQQAAAALAFKKAAPAVALVSDTLKLMTPGGLTPAWAKAGSILPEAAPPLWGLALCRVFADGGIDGVEKDALAECYALLTKAVEWWIKNRSTADGRFFYAYTHESGWDGAPVLPLGTPAISPDLAMWMALNARALESMAQKLGLADEAKNWAALAEKQLGILAGLWKNGGFVCRSAIDGAEAPCPAGIGLLPILLGDAAPDAAALAAQAEGAGKLPPLQAALIALGSPALAAKVKAAGAEVPGAVSGAAYSPVQCALLLAQ